MTWVECPRCGELQSNGLCQCLYFPNSLEKKAVGTGNLCGFCGAEGHGVDECSKRFAVYFPAAPAQAAVVVRAPEGFRTMGSRACGCSTDPERLVRCAEHADRASDPEEPAELTGVEAAAARAVETTLLISCPADQKVIMQRVREAMAARQAMGREKYPTDLADNHAPLKERVMNAWEEALDGAAYSQWMWEWWMSAESFDGTFDRSIPAGRAAIECLRLFSQAIVELDRLMRALGMEPVRKGGQP